MKYLTCLSVAAWAVLASVGPSVAHMPEREHDYHPRNPGKCGKHVGAYFPSYSKKHFPLSTVDMSLYSDVYFFYAGTTQTSALALDAETHVTGKDVKNFVAAAKAGGSRPVLAVGGWTGSVYFSPNVATPANRTAFAKSIVKFYRKYNFKGIDLDWEYPSVQGIGCNIISPDDIDNLISFLVELRAMLPRATLSMAVSMTGIKDGTGVAALDLSAMAKVLDYVNIMTYDAWGGWSLTTGPLAPMFDTCANDGLSVEKAVQIFMDQGFSASQLVVGIPSYGRSYTTTSSTLNVTVVGGKSSRIFQQKSSVLPTGGITDKPISPLDVCGNPNAPAGIWLVSQLVKDGYLSRDLSTGRRGYTRYFDKCSGTPFLFNKHTRHFISYDDLQSTVGKAKFAKSKGLRGVFFFDTAGTLPKVASAAAKAL